MIYTFYPNLSNISRYSRTFLVASFKYLSPSMFIHCTYYLWTKIYSWLQLLLVLINFPKLNRHQAREAEPKEYDIKDYQPEKRNLHNSTYHRIGNVTDGVRTLDWFINIFAYKIHEVLQSLIFIFSCPSLSNLYLLTFLSLFLSFLSLAFLTCNS